LAYYVVAMSAQFESTSREVLVAGTTGFRTLPVELRSAKDSISYAMPISRNQPVGSLTIFPSVRFDILRNLMLKIEHLVLAHRR